MPHNSLIDRRSWLATIGLFVAGPLLANSFRDKPPAANRPWDIYAHSGKTGRTAYAYRYAGGGWLIVCGKRRNFLSGNHAATAQRIAWELAEAPDLERGTK